MIYNDILHPYKSCNQPPCESTGPEAMLQPLSRSAMGPGRVARGQFSPWNAWHAQKVADTGHSHKCKILCLLHYQQPTCDAAGTVWITGECECKSGCFPFIFNCLQMRTGHGGRHLPMFITSLILSVRDDIHRNDRRSSRQLPVTTRNRSKHRTCNRLTVRRARQVLLSISRWLCLFLELRYEAKPHRHQPSSFLSSASLFHACHPFNNIHTHITFRRLCPLHQHQVEGQGKTHTCNIPLWFLSHSPYVCDVSKPVTLAPTSWRGKGHAQTQRKFFPGSCSRSYPYISPHHYSSSPSPFS